MLILNLFLVFLLQFNYGIKKKRPNKINIQIKHTNIFKNNIDLNIRSIRYPNLLFTEICVVGDVVYGVGDSVPPPEPCQRCLCAGVAGVACTSVQCPLRSGCRAVQRSDQCCPDYICGQ